jgi:site-specific recombinase XerC
MATGFAQPLDASVAQSGHDPIPNGALHMTVSLPFCDANPGRDQLMQEVAYFGVLRGSELVSLTWAQVIRCDSGEAQLDVAGKGNKSRRLSPTCTCEPRHRQWCADHLGVADART